MKSLSIIFLLILYMAFCSQLYTQESSILMHSSQLQPNDKLIQTRFNNNNFENKPFGIAGPCAGLETFFGIKGGVFKPVSIRNIDHPTRKRLKNPFPQIGAYYGAEINGFALYAAWGGLGVNAGLNIGPFTIDNSISIWGFIGEARRSAGYTTYNPKIGIQFWRIWLKFGPSFKLTNSEMLDNYLLIGKYQMNFEINFLITE